MHAAGGKTRQVWDNPILWREIATWAYGRRVLAIRLAYLVLVALAAAALYAHDRRPDSLSMASAALVLVPLFVLSLVLVNAQAVTSLTSERDGRALDLLLVTDLTAKEFVFGKLGGVFYNTKEMVLLPMVLCVYLWFAGAVSGENLLYLLGGLAVMNVFVAMLGVHAGMTYGNSRTAIGVSLGTVFFLFVGVATCMRMMIAFSGSFHWQIQPFLAFMLGGGVGLYAALGLAKSVGGHRRGLDALPDRHVLGHHQLLAAIHAERVSGDGGDLRLRHGRHAGAGDLRVRRRHRPHDRRRGMKRGDRQRWLRRSANALPGRLLSGPRHVAAARTWRTTCGSPATSPPPASLRT